MEKRVIGHWWTWGGVDIWLVLVVFWVVWTKGDTECIYNSVPFKTTTSTINWVIRGGRTLLIVGEFGSGSVYQFYQNHVMSAEMRSSKISNSKQKNRKCVGKEKKYVLPRSRMYYVKEKEWYRPIVNLTTEIKTCMHFQETKYDMKLI